MTKTLTDAREFILNEFLRYATSNVRTALIDEINEAFGKYADDEQALRAELYDIADYYYDDGLDAKMAIHELFDRNQILQETIP